MKLIVSRLSRCVYCGVVAAIFVFSFGCPGVDAEIDGLDAANEVVVEEEDRRDTGKGIPYQISKCNDNDDCTVDWRNPTTGECSNFTVAAGSWGTSTDQAGGSPPSYAVAARGCAGAIDITDGGTFSGCTRCSSDRLRGSCSQVADGRDVIFKFTIGVQADVSLSLDAEFSGTLYLRKGECWSSDKTCASRRTVIESTLEAGTYYVVVDGEGPDAYGDFTLTATLTPNCDACNDGNVCHESSCDLRTGCSYTDISCDDGDFCTIDNCDKVGGCVHTTDSCDDGDWCTDGTCQPEVGCVYVPTSCDDGTVCTVDSCDSRLGCLHAQLKCDDSDRCTNDSCDQALGCDHHAVTCDDGDACTDNVCDSRIGCTYPQIDCDDGNACTMDSCDGQSGCNHVQLDCNDGDICTVDTCTPESGCVYQSVVEGCDDGDACTVNSCDLESGECAYRDLNCDDSDACTLDSCDSTTGCVHVDVSCDDGDVCTQDSCDPDTGCVSTDVSCDDGSICTLDTCDPDAGCVYGALSCDNGDICTNDSCNEENGCVHEPVACTGGLCTINYCDSAVGCVSDAVECGEDGIGGTCGTCSGSDECVSGKCVWQAGTYDIECGDDGMCLVPAGSFWMGCNRAVDSSCSSNEKPYHEVTLSGYYMDKTEVTQSAYKKCVDAGSCTVPSSGFDPSGTPDRPVAYVNWSQATAYCTWAGKRLPTEAEWEKAARGTDGRKYPWGNETATCDYAVMPDSSAGGNGCGTASTWDVCSKSPEGDSPYGLCDMSGNVFEWVSDWYGSGYYSISPSSNPTGPDSGSLWVGRGGSWGINYYWWDRNDLRASRRIDFSGGLDAIGFRCARTQ